MPGLAPETSKINMGLKPTWVVDRGVYSEYELEHVHLDFKTTNPELDTSSWNELKLKRQKPELNKTLHHQKQMIRDEPLVVRRVPGLILGRFWDGANLL